MWCVSRSLGRFLSFWSTFSPGFVYCGAIYGKHYRLSGSNLSVLQWLRYAVESNALLFSLWASREDWFHGQVDAFDSQEQSRSGLRKSQIAAAPT